MLLVAFGYEAASNWLNEDLNGVKVGTINFILSFYFDLMVLIECYSVVLNDQFLLVVQLPVFSKPVMSLKNKQTNKPQIVSVDERFALGPEVDCLQL